MINYNNQNTFYLIPKEAMDELLQVVKDLRRMRDEMEGSSEVLGDYIPEEKAMELLRRGKTWFWNCRKSGILSGKKAAGRWYYRLQDIKKLIENGTTY